MITNKFENKVAELSKKVKGLKVPIIIISIAILAVWWSLGVPGSGGCGGNDNDETTTVSESEVREAFYREEEELEPPIEDNQDYGVENANDGKFALAKVGARSQSCIIPEGILKDKVRELLKISARTEPSNSQLDSFKVLNLEGDPSNIVELNLTGTSCFRKLKELRVKDHNISSLGEDWPKNSINKSIFRDGKIAEEEIKKFGDNRALVSLYLNNLNIFSFKNLATATRLKTLSLSYNSPISLDGVLSLPNLEIFHLSNTGIMNDFCELKKEWPRLHTLNLTGNKIADIGCLSKTNKAPIVSKYLNLIDNPISCKYRDVVERLKGRITNLFIDEDYLVRCQADSDDDGVGDNDDNCPDLANRDQIDFDGDGIGALCDPEELSDEVICREHKRWWKIDNYEEWKRSNTREDCTIYVDNAQGKGQSDENGHRVYNTIQSAFNSAVPGDVICVREGTYYERYDADDYLGLYINRGGIKQAPIAIAAIGKVIIDGNNEVDMGIYVSNIVRGDGKPSESSAPTFESQAKFVEIHGFHIINFKSWGILTRNSCSRYTNNQIYHNGQSYPDTNAEAFHNTDESVLRTDGMDNDHDGLIDELDEYRDKENLGRGGVVDAYFTKGNMFIQNIVHDNGRYYKTDCGDINEGGCPWVPPHCKDTPQEYGNVANIQGADHGFYLFSQYTLLERNKAFNNAGMGFDLYTHFRLSNVHNNIVYGNGATGIYHTPDGQTPNNEPDNNSFSGNLVYGNGLCIVNPGLRIGMLLASITSSQIINNIFLNNKNFEFYVGFDDPENVKNNIMGNNIFFNRHNREPVQGYTSLILDPASHNIFLDPKIENIGAGNYNLLSQSPAINNGLDFDGLPLIDFNGNPIIGFRDVGPIEYQSQ